MPYTSRWPDLSIPKTNLLSYLFPSTANLSDKPLWTNATDATDSLSPAQLLDYIRRFAVGLDKLGVARQEAVLVFSPNQIHMITVYLATAGSCRCFTGANPSFTIDEVAYQMKVVSPAVVLVHPSLLETGLAAAEKAGIRSDRVYAFGETTRMDTARVKNWLSILASSAEAKSWKWDPLEGDASTKTIAVINFSSGSTGVPKGVCITHRNLIANATQALFAKGQGPQLPDVPGGQRSLAFLPLYHAYSQLYTINIALKQGDPVFVLTSFSLETFLSSIQKHKITRIDLVPPVIVMLAKRPEVAQYDISSLRHLGCGGAPLYSDLQNEVMERHPQIVITQGWGMTETTCAGIMYEGITRDSTGSIGGLMANTQARLVDEDGRDAPEGVPGELWLKGPQIMMGYWKNEQATRDTFADGWLKTGDIAVTRNGKWWIVDRKKELIKVNGLQVAPAELEAVLLESDLVMDAAVTGITLHREEKPRAYVVLYDSAKASTDAKAIQDFVAGKVAKHKKLTGGVMFVDVIPKLASGKIIRKVMKEWAKRDAKDLEHSHTARL